MSVALWNGDGGGGWVREAAGVAADAGGSGGYPLNRLLKKVKIAGRRPGLHLQAGGLHEQVVALGEIGGFFRGGAVGFCGSFGFAVHFE